MVQFDECYRSLEKIREKMRDGGNSILEKEKLGRVMRCDGQMKEIMSEKLGVRWGRSTKRRLAYG